MKCPCCGRLPLSFAEHWRGFNAIRVQCRECGRRLKANHITWAWLLSCVSIMIGVFAYLFANSGNFVLPDEVGPPAIVLFVLFFAAMCWFTGGYVPVPTTEAGQQQGTTRGDAGPRVTGDSKGEGHLRQIICCYLFTSDVFSRRHSISFPGWRRVSVRGPNAVGERSPSPPRFAERNGP
jgi:hypothetical protein